MSMLVIPCGDDTSDATATADDILTGKTAYIDGEKVTGTIPILRPAEPEITIHGNGLVRVDITQGGGYLEFITKSTFYDHIPTAQGATITPGTESQIAVAQGLLTTGNVVVAGDADLVPGNIKSGVNIFGVTGTHVGGITPSGTISITGNGTVDVTNYASANVNVSGGGSSGVPMSVTWTGFFDGGQCIRISAVSPDGSFFNITGSGNYSVAPYSAVFVYTSPDYPSPVTNMQQVGLTNIHSYRGRYFYYVTGDAVTM